MCKTLLQLHWQQMIPVPICCVFLRMLRNRHFVSFFSKGGPWLSGRVLALGPVGPGIDTRRGTDDMVGKHRNSSHV